CFINHPFSPCDGVRMHPLTHPLPVTEHVSLLDVGYLTPARATSVTNQSGQVKNTYGLTNM
ncbi:hypothetical protein, partial [Escherichia coli]|uniref:hypothetical protein n=1 Tax=Escherichia coli TaxID=562 RepID=UPI003EE32203